MASFLTCNPVTELTAFCFERYLYSNEILVSFKVRSVGSLARKAKLPLKRGEMKIFLVEKQDLLS